MNERLTTRGLAESLADQTGLDRKRAEEFIDALSSYITQGIERNKVVKILGLGTFKVVLVRERESVHIQTGERFVIPAHHKLSFVPDKDFKEQINRPFAFFEPVETPAETSFETMESDDLVVKPQKVTFKRENEYNVDDEVISQQDEIRDSTVRLDGDDRSTMEEFYETPVVSDAKISLEHEDLPEMIDTVVPEINEEVTLEQDYDFSEIEEQSEIVEYTEPVSFLDHTEYKETEPELENTEYADVENKEEYPDTEQNKITEKKNKVVPLWLWFLLLPLLFVVGVGSGTYAFLQYNSDKTLKMKQSATVSEMVPETTESSPLPIGAVPVSDDENPEIENETGLIDNLISDGNANESSAAEEDNKNKNEESQSQPVSNAPEKKEEKKVIDWLALSSGNPRSETKRADKPNKEIEEKNKALANNARTKQTAANTAKTTAEKDKNTSSSTTSSAKTLPARVRMSAGSSLTQIAMEYYGDKIFWVYIYEHNKSRIKNFDNIPVGTELQLPSPKTYGIDAKSKTSVQKARQKQSQLMKWDNWDDYK
ncbi:MAG: HU family DNA-binding protein [Tannerella sp.]|nr:HU family DNA-binding protein [Tannerella sp.]